MPESRPHFHNELQALESEILAMGSAATSLLGKAMQALPSGDDSMIEAVITGDDIVDHHYLNIEGQILSLFALQTPVASDLRLLTVLLHVNLHLERVADLAVNIAKITGATHGLPRNPTVLRHLEEMGGTARQMVTVALDAFARRDLELCHRLPAMDDPIDRLNRGMLAEVLATANDRRMLEWGINMQVVSRQIERIGDHAVDIAEQVAFLVTGEFHEFVDASHPEQSPSSSGSAPSPKTG